MTHLELVPFAESEGSLVLGGLTIENGRDRVVLYGTIEVTRDRAGLVLARRLRAILEAAVATLEADPGLAAAVAPAKAPGRVKNPFG